MASLRRKLWVGIGVATVAGLPLAQAAPAADPPQDAAGPPRPGMGHGEASSSAAEGGEAYLTDGGPRDTRIRFYRDIGLLRGHLLVGRQLIELGLWEEAMPHFLHPTEELYGRLEKYIALHHMHPFRFELLALAQAVKAKRIGALEQGLAVVDRRLKDALDVASTFMSPRARFEARAASEMLKVAQQEYTSSIEGGRFVRPVEYQDSRGFVWEAERLFEQAAGELSRSDRTALDEIRRLFASLKTAWPDATPPAAPRLEPMEVAAIVADIERCAQRY
jgi:hypothetical protein